MCYSYFQPWHSLADVKHSQFLKNRQTNPDKYSMSTLSKNMHWLLDFGRPPSPLFVLRGQPKGPERMFALKVQTNILFDYFQTDLRETPRCRPFCLHSQDKHRTSSPKIQLLHKQTPAARTQSSCCCFTRKNKLTYRNWKICSRFALIYTVQFHGLVHYYVSLTNVWCIDRFWGTGKRFW